MYICVSPYYSEVPIDCMEEVSNDSKFFTHPIVHSSCSHPLSIQQKLIFRLMVGDTLGPFLTPTISEQEKLPEGPTQSLIYIFAPFSASLHCLGLDE